MTLGVETEGGVFSAVMERGTAVPYQAKRLFTTSKDAQDAIEVVVLQGERPLAKDNKRLGFRAALKGFEDVEELQNGCERPRKLGMFRLDRIPVAPKGLQLVDVFKIEVLGTPQACPRSRCASISMWRTVRISLVVSYVIY